MNEPGAPEVRGLALRTQLALAFASFVVLLACAAIGFFRAQESQEEARRWIDHTYQVLIGFENVNVAARETQAALRGYVAGGGEARYAEAYQRGLARFDEAVEQVRGLTADNIVHQARLPEIVATMERWRHEVGDRALALSPAELAAASRAPGASLFTGEIDQLTGRVDELQVSERDLLRVRTANLQATVSVTGRLVLAMVLIGLALIYVSVRITDHRITGPLVRLTALMTRLAGRDHDIVVPQLARGDEIGAMSRALEAFKRMAIETSDNAWVKTGVASLAGRLQDARDEATFGSVLVDGIAHQLGCGHAVLFALDEAQRRLRPIAGHGIADAVLPTLAVAVGEGLAGQCARDRQTRVVDALPEGYASIRSALGVAPPRQLLIAPLLLGDALLGVIELGRFAPFEPRARRYLDELLPVVALSQSAVQRALETRRLLAETQAQSATLREQNEILEILQRETHEKANALAVANRYKSEFLANMSHELRTPLNSLLILAKSLADNAAGHLDADEVESAQVIHDSGHRLLALINDILDLSKVEAGKMEIRPAPLALAEFVESLRRGFRHVAREKGLAFEIELQAGLPERIVTDAGRLEQIASNLLGNAFKFTRVGGVTMRFARPAPGLELPAGLEPERAIAISVRDTGIGIPREHFGRVFAVFEQVDSGASRQFGGTGLGLSIARAMARLLGGDVVFDSEPGHGSTFTILLPESAPPSAGDVDVGDDEPDAGPLRLRAGLPAVAMPDDDRELIDAGDTVILAIEDDPAFARVLVDLIRRKGYRALIAGEGETGLLLARQFRPAGVLLDLMLPGVDGWTVLDHFKADEALRGIPVHIVSALDAGARAQAEGAIGFLRKPVTKAALLDSFERLLHPRGDTRRVLLIEDDAVSRRATRIALADAGAEIVEADSAEAGLVALRGGGIDCIVLDLGLPGLSGFEFLEQARGEGQLPPVVIYSARDLSRDETQRLRQYTDSIVLKSARSQERLLDEVSHFLHSLTRRGGAAPALAPIPMTASAPAPNLVATEPMGAAPPTPRAEPASPSSASGAGAANEAAADAAAPAAMPAPMSAPAGEAGLAGRVVLIVDDDMRNVFALSRVLRARGFEVLVAQDGPKALRLVEQHPELDIALVDVMMPGMDGYETMRRVRADARHAALPMIAVTAKAMAGDREACLAAGANDYLSKPIDVERLVGKMAALLGERAG